jgi:hypothetical protein
MQQRVLTILVRNQSDSTGQRQSAQFCMQYGAFEDQDHVVFIIEYAAKVRKSTFLCRVCIRSQMNDARRVLSDSVVSGFKLPVPGNLLFHM